VIQRYFAKPAFECHDNVSIVQRQGVLVGVQQKTGHMLDVYMKGGQKEEPPVPVIWGRLQSFNAARTTHDYVRRVSSTIRPFFSATEANFPQSLNPEHALVLLNE
jgi:hypothetical protein